MNEEEQNLFTNEIISKTKSISGIDYIYFLDDNYHIIKEAQIRGTQNYLQEILKILKSESLYEKIGFKLYSKPFHTYTLLNENGLIVISKLSLKETLFMVVIAGENEPVDLINLLKICKESRLEFEKLQETNA